MLSAQRSSVRRAIHRTVCGSMGENLPLDARMDCGRLVVIPGQRVTKTFSKFRDI